MKRKKAHDHQSVLDAGGARDLHTWAGKAQPAFSDQPVAASSGCPRALRVAGRDPGAVVMTALQRVIRLAAGAAARREEAAAADAETWEALQTLRRLLMEEGAPAPAIRAVDEAALTVLVDQGKRRNEALRVVCDQVIALKDREFVG